MADPREGRSRKLEREEYVALRDILKQKIEEAGISQRSLSVRLGLSTSYINKLLGGKRTIEITEFFDICEVLKLDCQEIVAEIQGIGSK